MIITWYGFSCFKIQEQARDHEVSVLTDPFSPEDGKKLSRSLAADIVTVSHEHPRHDNVAAVGGEPFVVTGPGEYEVKEVFINGVATFHDLVDGKEKGLNTLYFINLGGLHLLHLGDLKHPLEEKHFEDLHDIDVLFLPIGGQDVLSAKQAVELVGQIEPRIIIPMHYKTAGFCGKCDPADPFLKAMSLGKIEALPRLKISEKDMPQEETKVIILEPQ
jgi:L-ascorbate metabolism protein UlaG (beta-lactamase superfamily)